MLTVKIVNKQDEEKFIQKGKLLSQLSFLSRNMNLSGVPSKPNASRI